MEYRNQVAAVTGGARGLGRATAQLLAQRGAAGVRELCRARRSRRGGGRGDCDRGRTGYRRGGGHRRLGRVPGEGHSRRSGTGSGDYPGEQRRGGLAGYARHLRPRAGRAHAPSKRGRRDPCHARSDGEHSGAALWADRQSGLDGGDRHRTVWQCILRGNEGRADASARRSRPRHQ